ncbi:MAG: hypothetical protein ACYCYE_18415 [Clostridia bacterium]
MEINIVKEVYDLKVNLMKVVKENPLPVIVKLMAVNELAFLLKNIEDNEIMSVLVKAQTDKKKEVEKIDE